MMKLNMLHLKSLNISKMFSTQSILIKEGI